MVWTHWTPWTLAWWIYRFSGVGRCLSQPKSLPKSAGQVGIILETCWKWKVSSTLQPQIDKSQWHSCVDHLGRYHFGSTWSLGGEPPDSSPRFINPGLDIVETSSKAPESDPVLHAAEQLLKGCHLRFHLPEIVLFSLTGGSHGKIHGSRIVPTYSHCENHHFWWRKWP